MTKTIQTHSNAAIHARKAYLSVVLGVLKWADGSLDESIKVTEISGLSITSNPPGFLKENGKRTRIQHY